MPETHSQNAQVIAIPHTHWDREWYLPFEEYRLRLTRAAEQLLGTMETDPAYAHFLFDGQTVVLEDLLAVKPDLAERLTALIRSERIAIGPWYVLQDEFLVGAESIVRNLFEGRRIAERFGRPMRVGYLPDAFGHIAQMPRVLRGFGIDATVLWRGVGDRAPGLEWRWRSPGGSEVLCLWLPFGYGIGANLPADPELAAKRVDSELDRQRPLSRAGVFLLMNGCDHAAPQTDLPPVLDGLRGRMPDVDIVHAGLEFAVDAVRRRVDDSALDVVEGELRRPGGGGNVLPGVLSARSWQKRDHDRAEWLVSRVTEPLLALAAIPRQDELHHAWRLLLRCQPHDSICGCSADTVHDEIDTRLGRVSQVASGLAREAVQAIAGDREPTAPVHRALAIFNPHPWAYEGPVEAEIEVTRDREPVRIVGESGALPLEILDSRAGLQQTENPPDPVVSLDTRRLRVRTWARVPAGGVSTLSLGVGSPGQPPPGTSAGDGVVSNQYLRVESTGVGLRIVDRATGAAVTHTFIDEGDRGDTYNFCPVGDVARDVDVISAEASTTASGALLRWRATMSVPARVTDDRESREGRVELGLAVDARLAPGKRCVEIHLRVDNRACDHRLRARLDLGEVPTATLTDTPFGWIARLPGLPEPVVGEEDVVANHPISSIVCSDTSTLRVGVGTVGLRDVEITPDGELLLTILRSVSWLSRPDLRTRRSPAGPPIYTPGAQGSGSHEFRYAIYAGPPAGDLVSIAADLDETRALPHAIALGDADVGSVELIEVSPASARLSIVKRSEDGRAWIVRLIGSPDRETAARVRLARPIQRAWLSDLDERPGSDLPIERDGSVVIAIPPGDIATLALAERVA